MRCNPAGNRHLKEGQTMRTMIIGSAFVLALSGAAFSMEAPVDGATVMTETEMDQARGGVGRDGSTGFYNWSRDFGSYTVSCTNGACTRTAN